MNARWTRAVLCLLCLMAAPIAGCHKDTPKSTRWEDAATTTFTIAPSSSVAVTATGTLNRFFPKDGEGSYKRVFAADKEGYAEAKLQKDGKDVAQLSISDAERLTTAKEKFDSATEKLEGFPVVKIGNNQTSALVKSRFQVKVSSATLDHEARKAILTTFDLKGLNSL